MLTTYFPILVTIILASGVVLGLLAVSILLGPKKYSPKKDDPFECGTIGAGSPRERMSVKFYLVAMIFILFDIEIAFMFPWAVNALDLAWTGFWAMFSFIVVLSVGLAYVWKRGVLDWI